LRLLSKHGHVRIVSKSTKEGGSVCARQHIWRVLSKHLAAGALFGVVCLSEALAGPNAQLLVIDRLQGSIWR
jgi:hypothetical protein